jgi:putative alpha-1,2-mannosidase
MVLSSPIFTHSKIANLTINATQANDDNRFIESLSVNGTLSEKSWIDEQYITQPVTLNFILRDTPNKSWGKAIEHRPPSFSAEQRKGEH